MNMTTATMPLTIAGLEAVYDKLAHAIDRAGEGRSELFLVKLALIQANALGDPDSFSAFVEAALEDLADTGTNP